ncbi:hypothetical protein [Mycobacterium sp. 852002-51971_SCH5477799-a]|uniref:hypothetical protein n=1 Tax=Mycobacterium sp. 852002-51971_SCH5477799-a TaxID=1834106 RepID=UPI000A497E2E|nr:hypothetical protein [Mycobacterium sp. 852002-51971_SCH5477799-a]
MATTATKNTALQSDRSDPNSAAQRIANCVQKALAAAPPLTSEQRDRIAAIMRGGAA